MNHNTNMKPCTTTTLNLISINQHNNDRLAAWQASIADLDWQISNRQQSTTAAFAKAIWLDISEPIALRVLSEICRQLDPSFDEDGLWQTWVRLTMELKARSERDELEAA